MLGVCAMVRVVLGGGASVLPCKQLDFQPYCAQLLNAIQRVLLECLETQRQLHHSPTTPTGPTSPVELTTVLTLQPDLIAALCAIIENIGSGHPALPPSPVSSFWQMLPQCSFFSTGSCHFLCVSPTLVDFFASCIGPITPLWVNTPKDNCPHLCCQVDT